MILPGKMDIEKQQGYGATETEGPRPPTEDCRTEHLGKHRQYWRDMILGVNDGLVSTFLLVAGVSGSGLTTADILLTSIAGALAGAVSMSAGEYVATKSQNEVLQGEIGLEKAHIRDFKKEEIKEVAELLETIGIPRENTELRGHLISHYENDPDALLKFMVALEFGVVEEEERSPLTAASVSGSLFVFGSLPSVLPFAVKEIPEMQSLLIATAATAVSLLVVGCVKTWATRGNCIKAAIENLSIAGLGGVLAYFVGVLFDKIIRD
jgi:VIT1/CCC1 family predicted Fe2+/Mn2+ transporter